MPRLLRVGLNHSVVVLGMAVDIVVWSGASQTRGGTFLPGWLPPAVMVACALPLFWRFRAPLLCFVPVWVVGCAALLVPQWQPFAGLLIALHAVASVRPSRISVPAAWSCAVPFGIDAVDSATHAEGVSPAAFGLAALWMIVTVAAWGFGRWTYRAQQRADAATAAALRADRLELARDLHDTIASNLTAMMVHASTARTDLGTEHPAVGNALATIDLAGNRAMDEMARLLGVLRSVESEPGGVVLPGPRDAGVDDLDDLVSDLARERGLAVTRAVVGTPRPLDAPADHAVYRVVQEALVNAAKHGDPATACRVRLEYGPTAVVVEVENRIRRETPIAPVPVPRLSFGWGLTGLRERVELVGGSFRAGSVGAVFVVRAALPARPAPAGPVPVEPARAVDA
jgi:signal transduction histidine kinase